MFYVCYCCPNHNYTKDVVDCINRQSAIETCQQLNKVRPRKKCNICNEEVIYYVAERILGDEY